MAKRTQIIPLAVADPPQPVPALSLLDLLTTESSDRTQMVAALREILAGSPSHAVAALRARRAATVSYFTQASGWRVLNGTHARRRDGLRLGPPVSYLAHRGEEPTVFTLEFPEDMGDSTPAVNLTAASLAEAMVTTDTLYPMAAWWLSLQELQERRG